jgi:Tfp pilus assembly protein PilN
MLRINLLPPEVLDHRRFEGWYRYIFIVTTGLALLVLLTSAGLYLLVQQRNDSLQTQLDLAAQYTEQGKAFDVFEEKEKAFTSRQALAQAAMADRIDLGKVSEELSMILPDEVWFDSMGVDQNSKLSIAANTPRSSSQSLDVSYKSVAKTLVRMNDLSEVTDVWLSNATNGTWSSWDGSTVDTVAPVVQFTVSAQVLKPSQEPQNQQGSR